MRKSARFFCMLVMSLLLFSSCKPEKPDMSYLYTELVPGVDLAVALKTAEEEMEVFYPIKSAGFILNEEWQTINIVLRLEKSVTKEEGLALARQAVCLLNNTCYDLAGWSDKVSKPYMARSTADYIGGIYELLSVYVYVADQNNVNTAKCQWEAGTNEMVDTTPTAAPSAGAGV